MRTVKITCDRCGREIEGYPVKIIPECVDRHDGDLVAGEDAPRQEEQCGKDYCRLCTEKIIAYANTDANIISSKERRKRMTHEEFKEKFMPREVSYVKTHTVEGSISALGAVNCKQGPIGAAVGALEKLIPASVKECPFIAMPGAKGNPPVMAAHLKCPVCNADVDMVRHSGYCGRCGKRIDWDGYDKSHWIDEVYYIDRRRE